MESIAFHALQPAASTSLTYDSIRLFKHPVWRALPFILCSLPPQPASPMRACAFSNTPGLCEMTIMDAGCRRSAALMGMPGGVGFCPRQNSSMYSATCAVDTQRCGREQ